MTSRVEEGRCRVDRCALFVDAGYLLADGATAVHGSISRDSVSWDYPGLLRFLANLSADRTGQQLLRCYWYEATVDGHRTPEHDTLADLPGLTLRLGRIRPGQRGGVETDMHRDLTTLARSRAISDVLLASAEEDLAQVIADVQDLGIRVMIAHISVDGNWTVSRSLRQQCDDVVQIDRTQLQPYVELIAGAEPARYDQPYAVGVYGGKPLANGHAASAGGSGSPERSSGFAGSVPSPPATYTTPAVTEYQPPARPPAGPRDAPSAPAAGAGSPRYADLDPGSFRDPAAPALPGPPAAPPAPDPGPMTDPTLGRGSSVPPDPLTSAPPSSPGRRGGPANDLHAGGAHREGRHANGLPAEQSPQSRPGPSGPQPAREPAGTGYIPEQGSHDAQLPVPSTAGKAPAGGSLADTAATAQSEGFEFGKSVARDAPVLWLEAVLARKPRMPSDLEARLLQGSALPIEALLHDEVRQALRRGFWDALERSRR